jgi:phosphatidylserine decarboxylase
MHLRIAKEGYPFILLSLFIGIAALFITREAGLLFIGIALFCAFFFRDPVRVSPQAKNLILSPADGKIVDISEVSEDTYLKGKAIKVSIFLSLFNVHINYAPIEGRVAFRKYTKGTFKFAFVDKASDLNENNALGIENAGTKVLLKQIAGKVARRIVCRVDVGDEVGRGERFGMIRFGSRVDLYLDPACKINVRIGETVTGGITVIGACDAT